MKKNSVIHGKPIYLYKGTQYVEMPDKCVIKKVVYDEETGLSRVYCAKRNCIIEVLSALVIIACVYVNLFVIHDRSLYIRYNSSPVLYDGYLYVNIYNDSANGLDLKVQITGASGFAQEYTVESGSYLLRVPTEDSGEFTIQFSYKNGLTNVSEEVTLTPIRRGD